MKILLIDNYDSFTFNLYHYISSLKVKVDVVRNDKINSKEILKKNITELLFLQDQVIQINLVIVLIF
jgi:anthranilate/para-aminobenzoate synthase component II